MSESEDARQRGRDIISLLNGEVGHERFRVLAEVAPDFSDWILKSAYGDLLARPQLPLRERELATVAALAAMGTAPNQLRAHIEGSRRAGLTKEEIVEVISQMAIYAGVPAAINGLLIAREVFAAEG